MQPVQPVAPDRPARLLRRAAAGANPQENGCAGHQIDRASIARHAKAIGHELKNLHAVHPPFERRDGRVRREGLALRAQCALRLMAGNPVQEHHPRRSFGKRAAASRSVQKFRIECCANVAISHCRRVARQRSGCDPRGRSRRPHHRLRRGDRAVATPPGGLRPRAAHGHRVRSRGGARRRAPRSVDRRADRALHSEQGLGELAADDVLGAGATARRLGGRSAGGHTAASGPRRSRRRREVRPRRYPRRARARERPRDRGPCRNRLNRPAAALPARHRHRQPRRFHWITFPFPIRWH